MQLGMSEQDIYSSLLQTSIKNRDPFLIKPIHARVIKSGLHLGVFLMNNLINAYAKTGYISDAHRMFDEMPVKNISSHNTLLSAYAKMGMVGQAFTIFNNIPYPDSVSWTSMIVGYNQMGRYEVALRMFWEMIKRQITPTEYNFTNIIASCSEMDVGRKVHSLVVKFGLAGYVSVANSLVNMYAKTGDVKTSFTVLERIKLKNTSSWNALISLHMREGEVEKALSQFEEMKGRDIISWNSMIAGYNQHGFNLGFDWVFL